MSRATLKLPVFPERGTGPRKSSPKRKLRATISAPMPAISAQLIDALCSTNDSIRGDAAAQIYNTGVAPALIIAQEWQQNDQLAGLLATPHLHATVGLAVFPDVFAKIRV